MRVSLTLEESLYRSTWECTFLLRLEIDGKY